MFQETQKKTIGILRRSSCIWGWWFQPKVGVREKMTLIKQWPWPMQNHVGGNVCQTLCALWRYDKTNIRNMDQVLLFFSFHRINHGWGHKNSRTCTSAVFNEFCSKPTMTVPFNDSRKVSQLITSGCKSTSPVHLCTRHRGPPHRCTMAQYLPLHRRNHDLRAPWHDPRPRRSLAKGTLWSTDLTDSFGAH